MAKIGVSTEILDGNLNRRVTLPEDVVICVSRAVSGPSNDIYTVSDTDAANRIFGSSSPIIQLMNGALAGGAPSELSTVLVVVKLKLKTYLENIQLYVQLMHQFVQMQN